MKKHILLLFCFVSLSLIGSAQQDSILRKDTIVPAKNHKVNFSFNWFEVGASIPFKEKKILDLPYGMNSYLYGPKTAFAAEFFGIGLYYKDHWGLSTIFNMMDYTVPDAAFKNYIASQYPGHYFPFGVQGHTYSLYKINYRLSYRFHKGHFIFEPQFQLGINDCDDFDTHFVLKEEGSNQFIEYDIKKENVKKNLFSYHAAMMVHWCVTKSDWKWNVEPGLRLDLMVIPTNFNYTVTSTHYNMPAAVYEMNVKRMRPALTITAFMSVFRK